MENKSVFNVIKILVKYPLEVILCKHLMINGVDSEEKLIALLNTEPMIAQTKKVNLQNSFRDIKSGFYDFKKIPLLFK